MKNVPSAVTRARSHEPQKGWVVEAMTPNVRPSGSRNRSAGAAPRPHQPTQVAFDAVLVMPRDRAQDVKLVVEALKKDGRKELL